MCSSDLEKAVDEQVNAAFTSLRERVRAELGGVVEETQRTLDDLRTRRTQAAARGEQEAAQLTTLAEEIARIEERLRSLSTELRALAPA